MRVAFDEQIFLLQQQGGVSRYFVELLRNLPEADPPVDVTTPFRRVVNRHALEALGGTASRAHGVPRSRTRNSPQQPRDPVDVSASTSSTTPSTTRGSCGTTPARRRS